MSPNDKQTVSHQQIDPDLDEQFTLFNQEGVYKVDTISHALPKEPLTYSDILLKTRIDLVSKYAACASVLDVCCATGQQLSEFDGVMSAGVGLDFSLPYLQKASEDSRITRLLAKSFACGDAKKMPFCSNYFDVAYSFSALYIIPDVGKVINEISRVLKPDGVCILDLGNLYSLNVVVVRSYHKELGWAQQFPISVREMKRLIKKAGLEIVEHRSFQILPLWGADRPGWLRFVLLPAWTHFMKGKMAGRMIDEWISSLPLLKFLAFRQLFVCKKVVAS